MLSISCPQWPARNIIIFADGKLDAMMERYSELEAKRKEMERAVDPKRDVQGTDDREELEEANDRRRSEKEPPPIDLDREEED
jgi:hypothetical protein